MRRIPADIDPTDARFVTRVYRVRDPEEHPAICSDLGDGSTDTFAISEVLLHRVQQAAKCGEDDAAQRIVLAVSRDAGCVVEGAEDTVFDCRWVTDDRVSDDTRPICGALVVTPDEEEACPRLIAKAEERVREMWRREFRRVRA